MCQVVKVGAMSCIENATTDTYLKVSYKESALLNLLHFPFLMYIVDKSFSLLCFPYFIIQVDLIHSTIQFNSTQPRHTKTIPFHVMM